MILPAMTRSLRPHVVAAGSVLHRIHDRRFPRVSFNPCLGASTRFAPLHDAAGSCVPTFYAAGSFDVAAFESVFRDISGPFASLPIQALDDRAHSILVARRSFEMVGLFAPELIGWGLDAGEVFSPLQTVYPITRELASRIHRDNPTAHGLIWPSVRDGSAHAMLFFGDRADPADFAQQSTRVSGEPGLLDDFRNAAARAGCRISR